ncbi:riboflavin synthase [Sediminitomix flava]|uniref:Riboflavin synthase n=1 Tax=Sediminitomix flava TaxID=379075 RepID=A0A315Z9W1_SEDFL|nr:riboflavin synthase [Sediminitomix flava]PWJ42321.1 riboflavin synthase alpha chain [Sediminitomix flava]
MFTGIIETLGEVVNITKDQENIIFRIKSEITPELKIDQSVAHNGVCLTVTKVEGDEHEVVAIQETLDKTNLGALEAGHKINIERCTAANGRFDGHIVQGHVDQTATCIAIDDEQGSWRFTFEYDPTVGNFTVQKGSITVNGVSLTVAGEDEGKFSVAIIPYTFEHTTFHQIKVGDKINLEFDIIGKYVQKLFERTK